MKKILYLLLFSIALTTSAQKAKYIFYFIGDGMGVNQVGGAETFLAAQEGRIGVKQLCFTQFPHLALATTYSANRGVTDSAASGTALSCGKKTNNSVVGLAPNLQTPLVSIAQIAHQNGAAVGVSTSVSIDHATPAVFYAHVPERHDYYTIGSQLPASGYDFFAGSDFRDPLPHRRGRNIFNSKKGGKENLYRMAEDSGYTIVRGYPNFCNNYSQSEKIILFQPEVDSKYYRKTLQYKIDQHKKHHLTLPQITSAGINFLTHCNKRKENNKDGFFFMIEGGMIDMACHSNDAACYIHELIDMDKCIKQAYDFYRQHPDSTLIVVTADHETGGISLGRGKYELHMDRLLYQNVSCYDYTKQLAKLRKEKGDAFTWDFMKKELSKHFGFWTHISLTPQQEQRLYTAYKHMAEGKNKNKKSLYAEEDEISTAASDILNEVSGIGWQSNGHSNGFVGVYAIGAGADLFHGQIDNTDIPKFIRKAAGWHQ